MSTFAVPGPPTCRDIPHRVAGDGADATWKKGESRIDHRWTRRTTGATATTKMAGRQKRTEIAGNGWTMSESE